MERVEASASPLPPARRALRGAAPTRKAAAARARALGAGLVWSVVSATTAGAAIPDYQLVGTFSLPTGSASYDVLPDGRAVAIVGASLFTQDVPGSSSFLLAGSVPTSAVSAFGASFLRVSPGGTRIAVGDNDFGAGAGVFVFDAAGLSPGGVVPGATYPIDNYDAHWSDEGTLWVTGGSLTDTLVTRLDATAGTHGHVIAGIAGASAGITTDATHLYTGNGFAFGGGSATGDIKAFTLTSLTPGNPLNFEATGTLVASTLSANSLGFDLEHNLLVGGGPGGFAAVVDGGEVVSALAGGPVASTLLPLSPSSADSFYTRFNPATGEVLVTTFGDPTVWRYAVVPAPASALVLASLPGRRRRRA